jgi:protein tyrosine/serine phosphatase
MMLSMNMIGVPFCFRSANLAILPAIGSALAELLVIYSSSNFRPARPRIRQTIASGLAVGAPACQDVHT